MKKVFSFTGYTDGDVGYDFPKDTKYFRFDNSEDHFIDIEYIFPANNLDEILSILKTINESIRCGKYSRDIFQSVLNNVIKFLEESKNIKNYKRDYDFGNQDFAVEISDFIKSDYIAIWMSENNISLGTGFSILHDDNCVSKEEYFISDHNGYELYECSTGSKNNNLFIDLLSGNFDILKEEE